MQLHGFAALYRNYIGRVATLHDDVNFLHAARRGHGAGRLTGRPGRASSGQEIRHGQRAGGADYALNVEGRGLGIGGSWEYSSKGFIGSKHLGLSSGSAVRRHKDTAASRR